MLEILILYSVYKREKTLYGIRKEIFDIFGAYTKPSIGALHPAIKKLTQKGALSCSERFSDGGKKSSYYAITKSGMECFKELFFSTLSENPSLFYSQLQIRFAALGLLTKEDRIKFVSETQRKIDLYVTDIQSRLNDEYLELDYFQRQIMTKSLSDMKSLTNYIKQLKVENAG